jgi:hypothetical protein
VGGEGTDSAKGEGEDQEYTLGRARVSGAYQVRKGYGQERMSKGGWNSHDQSHYRFGN